MDKCKGCCSRLFCMSVAEVNGEDFETMANKKDCRKRVLTNADRIRAMSDEELAVFLADEIDHSDCYDCRLECATYEGDKFEDSCHNAYYRWLKQPAEEE